MPESEKRVDPESHWLTGKSLEMIDALSPEERALRGTLLRRVFLSEINGELGIAAGLIGAKFGLSRMELMDSQFKGNDAEFRARADAYYKALYKSSGLTPEEIENKLQATRKKLELLQKEVFDASPEDRMHIEELAKVNNEMLMHRGIANSKPLATNRMHGIIEQAKRDYMDKKIDQYQLIGTILGFSPQEPENIKNFQKTHEGYAQMLKVAEGYGIAAHQASKGKKQR